MLLPKFDYHEPTTLHEACQTMAELREEGRPLAGGTDLLVSMRKGVESPRNLVSLGSVDELKGLVFSGRDCKLGACMTAAELAESSEIRRMFCALSDAANHLGSPLVRNIATIGGNVVTARPAADLVPPLMVYAARAVLKKSAGERTVPLEDFFRGPGDTVVEPDEILSEIVMEKPLPNSGSCYLKLGRRKTLVISLVNVAAFLTLDEAKGMITEARLALGAVAPVPMRAYSAENTLAGQKPSESLFAKAGEIAAHDSRPIDDFRGSAEYRRAMIKVLAKRALAEAYRQAARGTSF